ncbi:acyl-CoA dehydrogenase family protein [Spirillospora sp. CA-255316]
MNFLLSEDQQYLSELLDKYLTERSSEEVVREAMASHDGHDMSLWRGLAGEVGVLGLAIPEEYGGAGLGVVELGIVQEALGASLACVPYFSTVVLAASCLAEAPEELKGAWLPRVADGSAVLTLVAGQHRTPWLAEPLHGAEAIQTAKGWKLSGSFELVLDAHVADALLVVAIHEGTPSLFLVAKGSDGLTVDALSMMDQTRRFAKVEFSHTPAELAVADAGPVLARVRDVAMSALAAEQIGGARRCLDLTVSYAKTRLQFGRPIGSFQSIKHRCADMLIQIESAQAATRYALWSADHDKTALPIAAAMAKITASEAYSKVAGDTIQVHGGIGFTWEHPAHLYFKRAKSTELWLGDPSSQRQRLAKMLDLAPV